MSNHSSGGVPRDQASAAAGRPARRQWPLTVVDVQQLTPHFRRVYFEGEELLAFDFRPGQDVSIYFPSEENPNRRRHYTVRGYDPASHRIWIDFLLHGEGPGALWAQAARPGEEMMLSGPANRHQPDPDADWYLFAGDDTALPAIFGMLEALPAGKRTLVFLEVAGPEEEQELVSPAEVDLTWLHRNGTPGEASDLLHRAIAGRELPRGHGDVFLAGETGRMRELRRQLLDRGLAREQIFAMGYWRPGRFGGDETIRDD